MASPLIGRVGFMVYLAQFRICSASSFLSRAQDGEAQDLTPQLEASIFKELEDLMSSSKRMITQSRLDRIEDMLRPTYKALPKTKEGKLGHIAVRYALHSYFVQRHAWSVRGLSSLGGENDTLSATSILQDRVEEFVQAAFERRLGSRGLDLKDVALLGATYENLIRKEMQHRLDQTFQLMEITAQSSMPIEEVDNVIDAYMMGYIMNLDYAAVLPHQLKIIRESMNKIFPTWPDTQQFLRDVRRANSFHKHYFTRSDVETIIEGAHDQFGHWQNNECQALKAQMLAIEDKSIGINGSGRVRLSDFYNSALRDQNWQFSENAEYLAQNGALDTHGGQRVIISNYINSPSNCIASSKFYSVCCINECEDLMDHIEHHFEAPSASPDAIVRFVSALPSASVSAGRSLQMVLVNRLEEIARRYDGNIPLHGRLFAQWMHHAYPRECPYPHVSGTTRLQTVAEYMAKGGQSPVIRQENMSSVLEAVEAAQTEVIIEDSEECTQWSHHEELYVDDHRENGSHEKSRGPWAFVRPFVYICLAGALMASLGQRLQEERGGIRELCGYKQVVV